MSHECHDASNYWQLDCLFNTLFRLTTKSIKILHYRPFARGKLLWLVDSLHKGPVMQTVFPCCDVILADIYQHIVIVVSYLSCSIYAMSLVWYISFVLSYVSYFCACLIIYFDNYYVILKYFYVYDFTLQCIASYIRFRYLSVCLSVQRLLFLMKPTVCHKS